MTSTPPTPEGVPESARNTTREVGMASKNDAAERARLEAARTARRASSGNMDELTERVSALPEYQQLMLLHLLIGSNPEDVVRELAIMQQALAAAVEANARLLRPGEIDVPRLGRWDDE